MVLYRFGKPLYDNVMSLIRRHLSDVAGRIAAERDENLLQSLSREWEDHKVAMIMIRDIMMYLDRAYVAETQPPVLPVYDSGMLIFREEVARSPRIKPRFVRLMLDWVHRERLGEVIDRPVFKNLVSMLLAVGVGMGSPLILRPDQVELQGFGLLFTQAPMSGFGSSTAANTSTTLGREPEKRWLKLYQEDFESAFLKESQEFFARESQEFLKNSNAPAYLQKADRRRLQELERCRILLDLGSIGDQTTETKLDRVLCQELVAVHLNYIVALEQSGFAFMLEHDQHSEAALFYKLASLVDTGPAALRTVLQNTVKTAGLALVKGPEVGSDPLVFIQKILDLKQKYDIFCTESFTNDKQFRQAVNNAFDAFMNLNQDTAEYLSLFLNEQLRTGFKGHSEDEIEQILDRVIVLFRFLQAKDMFEKYYKQHLAKRLLFGRSVSDDAERSMIAKLKSECGYQFTSKLEGMFTDMRTSADMDRDFRRFVQTSVSTGPLAVDLTVSVLTTGCWPTHPVPKCTLTPELERAVQTFERFYLNARTGRRLTWQMNMGTADVKCVFRKSRHEINMPTYHMVVLMLFNEQEALSCRDIQQQTAIPMQELQRVLLALACGKYRILSKEPKSDTVDSEDVFRVNVDFHGKLLKFKIGNVTTKENTKEKTETREKVEEDRKHQIDAAIVRVMKARKKLEHNNLVAEVVKQLSSRFAPNVTHVKGRIESLIDREFLERDAEDRRMYNYLA